MFSGDDAWRPTPTRDDAAESLPGCRDLVEIARGGDSVVYRAWQENPGRQVAVKVLTVDDDATAARFARELAITVDLGRQHPHIVTVLDTGRTASGRPCIVMDLAELGTLHDRLQREGPLPVADVVTVGTVVSDALAFAHGRGVLHRDVKPQNILILPTSYVLTDFGIARLSDSEHTASVERFTYRHASPQVLDGRAPTAADDVWSLGSTLFTLLDGRPPFADDDPDEDTALAYLRRVRTEEPRPLDDARVPPDLAAVVLRCLAKDPAQRWPDAAALHDALADLTTEVRRWAPPEARTRTGAAPVASPDPTSVPPDPTRRRSEHSGTSPTGDAPWAPRTTAEPEQRRPEPVPEPVPEPAPEPVPAPVIAASALAHVVPTPDALPTGAALPDDAGPLVAAPPLAAPPAPEAPAERPRARRLILLACVVLGLVLGTVVAAMVRGGDSSTTTRPDPRPTEAGPLPIASDPPSDTGLAQPPVADPQFGARITEWTDRGATIDITWTDGTNGTGRFVVADSSSGTGTGNYQVPAGQTTFSVPVSPDQKRVCLVVLTISADGSAAYPGFERCANRK